MIFSEGHSSLVRLSDSVKCSVQHVLETGEKVIAHHRKHSDALNKIQRMAKEHLKNEQFDEESMAKLKEVSEAIPLEEAQIGAALQVRLNTEVLQVILMSCFTLESYINSLGFYLLKERDLLGLVGNSSEAICDTFLAAIDKMRTIDKWQTIGALKRSGGFSLSEPPFQDLKILFNYRNDHVHDKVVDWGQARANKRYNNKLPEPFGDLLEPKHAVYACDTYWGMVKAVHQLVEVPMEEFHGHYNLSPWFDESFEKHVRKLARDYPSI